MKRFYTLIVFCFVSIGCLQAQDTVVVSSKWHLSAGLNLVTVPTYHIVGTDTGFNNSLSIGPSVSLSHNSGFAISYSPRFVLGGPSPGLYMHAVSIGISNYDKPVFDYSATYAHYFFTGNKSLPYTPLTNEIYADITYKKTWLRPSLAAGIGFGKNTETSTATSVYDMGLSAGLSHAFDWESGDVGFSVIPAVLLNAGTNEYFSFLNITKYIGHSNKFVNYIKKGTGAKNRRGGTGSSGTTATNAVPGEQFNITNLQLDLESSIDINALSIRPTASLFLPVGNSAGSNATVFWQFALQYKF